MLLLALSAHRFNLPNVRLSCGNITSNQPSDGLQGQSGILHLMIESLVICKLRKHVKSTPGDFRIGIGAARPDRILLGDYPLMRRWVRGEPVGDIATTLRFGSLEPQ